MKLNWGTGIALFYGAFALTMLGVVFASQQHKPGLVSEKYYDLDLHYEARLEQKQNTANLQNNLKINYSAQQAVVELQFPAEIGAVSGKVTFYRPSDGGSDFTVQIGADAEGKMFIPVAQVAEGIWRVQVEWEAAGKRYFFEEKIRLRHA